MSSCDCVAGGCRAGELRREVGAAGRAVFEVELRALASLIWQVQISE